VVRRRRACAGPLFTVASRGLQEHACDLPELVGKIHPEPKGFLRSIAMEVVGAKGPMVKTGSTCGHGGAKLTADLPNFAGKGSA
jgi:hypothetical protein